MATVYEGTLSAQGKRFAIVAARFNEHFVKNLVDGALDCLRRHGVEENHLDIYWVPGVVEIPLIAQKVAQQDQVDAVICLGIIIRGATPHFDYVAGIGANGIASVSLETGKPVIFGVLTTENLEQTMERAGTKAGNKGWDAAQSAIEMTNLIEKITPPDRR